VTAPAPYATLTDVVARYEGTIPADREAWVTTLLDEATSKLDDTLPDLRSRIDSGEVSAQRVRWIVVGAVLRVVRNPRGIRQEMLGAYNVTRQMPATAPAEVAFTADELAELSPPQQAASIVGSAALSLPYWRVP
jgi:hypothetical protein